MRTDRILHALAAFAIVMISFPLFRHWWAWVGPWFPHLVAVMAALIVGAMKEAIDILIAGEWLRADWSIALRGGWDWKDFGACIFGALAGALTTALY